MLVLVPKNGRVVIIITPLHFERLARHILIELHPYHLSDFLKQMAISRGLIALCHDFQ